MLGEGLDAKVDCVIFNAVLGTRTIVVVVVVFDEEFILFWFGDPVTVCFVTTACFVDASAELLGFTGV